MSPINIEKKFSLFSDQWSPKTVALLNDCEIKLAKFEGEFVWHSHADTDELFLLKSGKLRILFRDGEVSLSPGEMLVVPRGVEHKPVTDGECEAIMISRQGEPNTGTAGGERTAAQGVWI